MDSRPTPVWKTAAFLAPALVIYLALAAQLNFVQDDAYISYRYVANFLDGHGLVFNIGERVEGFTNFGWVILLSLFGRLGLDYIVLSQIVGLLCGGGVIVMTYLLGKRVLGEPGELAAIAAAYLVGANLSLAYWSPAGLETAAFALAAIASLYWYLGRSRWLVFGLLMAVWIRPEGGLIALLLLGVEAIEERRLPTFVFYSGLIAFVLSLPFVVFKIMYYGSIFPNPFYAKTGWDLEQMKSGLEYAGRFFMHYGFYGLGLIVPLLFFRKLNNMARSLWLFTVGYIAYIVLVGGDVLKAHRFFLPLFGPAAVLMLLSVQLGVKRLKPKTRTMVVVLVALPLLAVTWFLPNDFVTSYNRREKTFTRKMQLQAQHLLASDTTAFSVALPTIGIFGYELLGHNVIDMLGLTDRTIARESEDPIPGMQTTWKEQSHNSAYLLRRAPDYILFSTGIKPSAPAEMALLLYPAFQQAYRTVGWYFKVSEDEPVGNLHPVYKRVRPVSGELKPTYPVEYAQFYKAGLDRFIHGGWKEAVQQFDKALRVSPKPYYPYLVYNKAFCHLQLGQVEESVRLDNWLLEQDSMIFEVHRDLYLYESIQGDQVKAAVHRRWIKELVPWYWPRIDSLTQGRVAAAREAAGRRR